MTVQLYYSSSSATAATPVKNKGKNKGKRKRQARATNDPYRSRVTFRVPRMRSRVSCGRVRLGVYVGVTAQLWMTRHALSEFLNL